MWRFGHKRGVGAKLAVARFGLVRQRGWPIPVVASQPFTTRRGSHGGAGRTCALERRYPKRLRMKYAYG